MLSTIDVTGWCSANALTGPGIDSVGTNAELTKGRRISGYENALAPSRTIIKGKKTLLGGDNELLPDALEMASRFKSTDIGSPIVDEKGDVVGMIAKACAPIPNQPCSRVPFGVPVSAIKAFLRTVPANAVPPAPWLGIQGVADDVGPAPTGRARFPGFAGLPERLDRLPAGRPRSLRRIPLAGHLGSSIRSLVDPGSTYIAGRRLVAGVASMWVAAGVAMREPINSKGNVKTSLRDRVSRQRSA